MRKTLIVTIDAEGRDKGRVYKITEMPATRAEKWAMRAFLGMARAGIEVPEDIASAGLAGIAMLGIRAVGSMQFDDAESLMDEMFGCIQYIPDPRNQDVVRNLIEDDIEEIGTRIRLRKEVFGLHVSFSKLADRLTSASAASQAAVAPST